MAYGAKIQAKLLSKSPVCVCVCVPPNLIHTKSFISAMLMKIALWMRWELEVLACCCYHMLLGWLESESALHGHLDMWWHVHTRYRWSDWLDVFGYCFGFGWSETEKQQSWISPQMVLITFPPVPLPDARFKKLKHILKCRFSHQSLARTSWNICVIIQ